MENTVDKERFPGLNICGFSTIRVFTEILSHCLGHKCSLFSAIKERHLRIFTKLKTAHENVKV